MPNLQLTNFNVTSATFGGFITIFGLVSYLCKGRFYLSECLIALIAGLIVSPHAANFIRPLEYTQGSQSDVEYITLYFSRLVLAIQLVLAGVELPSRYCLKEWKPLALLLGPGMTAMWLFTALVTWAMVPHLTFLHALAVGACVTPTDPVLSSAIVKGKYADDNVPPDLQKLIVAEAGANDGLGYPFLFLALYLIQYKGMGGLGQDNPSVHKAIGLWFGETWGYTILLSVVYGAVVGYLAKVALRWAEHHKYVDRENFLIFAVTLALFIMGTCGMIGSDDILACFVAGNAFTIDDWFRLETVNDSVQPTIDMLLNLSVFMWYGAICPWAKFAHNDIIPIYRLVFLGILVLLVRRIPIIFAMYKGIRQIENARHAAFVGFFGPVGVGAVFYLYLAREYISEHITVDGKPREDVARLADTTELVIWFVVLCSVIVHGLTVPCGKLVATVYRLTRGKYSSDDNEEYEMQSSASQSPFSRLSSMFSMFSSKSTAPDLPFSQAPTMANTPSVSIAKPELDGQEAFHHQLAQQQQWQQQQQQQRQHAVPARSGSDEIYEAGGIEGRATDMSVGSESTVMSTCQPAGRQHITFGKARTSGVE